jgi:hypothetical protein
MPTPWLGIAFRHMQASSFKDEMVSFMTGGDSFVHTEVLLADQHGNIRPYAASDNDSGFRPSPSFNRAKSTREPNRWTAIKYPLNGPDGYKKAYAILLYIVSLGLPYNTGDLWQCCFEHALPTKEDLDCERPHTWTEHGVFCSQVALLILRTMVRQGLITVPSPYTRDAIENTNSRGCSPNQLFQILSVPLVH